MFHRHKWRNVSAQLMMISYPWNKGANPITTVLQKCKCESIRTFDIDGHWTIEQINEGDSDATTSTTNN